MGYEFYEKVVPNEDLDMLLEMNQKGFDFFYNLPVNRRDKASISYDFRLKRKDTGSEILVNQKLTPLILTDTGNIWFALCLVSLSVAEKSGNVFITFNDKDERFDYDFLRKQFKPTIIKHLSKREKDVLHLMIKGNSACEMSQKLFISEETVKFHKRNIIKKLNVKSAMEAVYVATINKLV
ncbi:helix-turn-helix transcriptional regulator [Ancylomarina sp. M3P]|nr:helix-turn-helix transcriptional regulator [Ancylomarina euxinus]